MYPTDPINYSNNSINSGKRRPILEWHEIKFIAVFSFIFLGTIALLSAFGFIPSEFEAETSGPSIIDVAKNAAISPVQGQNGSAATSTFIPPVAIPQNYDLPVRITIPSVAVDGIVKNPTSTNVDVLDTALLAGAVRYPGSGVPGVGNMFIFGHSTGFRIVQNNAYKIFNTIKNAKVGSEVMIYAGTNIYIYKVTSVKLVNKDNTLVSFDTNGPARLTLSTCDSFGTKSDRYVVEADFDRVAAN